MPVTNMPVLNPTQIHPGLPLNVIAPHMMAERQPIPSVQFRHQENVFFMPVMRPQFNPLFHQILPHHFYTPHTMMEMRQQYFTQSIQSPTAGRISNDASLMTARGFYSTPQPPRRDLPLLSIRQSKPIRIQDPNKGGQDVSLDELRRGRTVLSVTQSPQPEPQRPVQPVGIPEGSVPTTYTGKIIVRTEIVEKDENKEEQTEKVMGQNKQVASSTPKSSKSPTWAEVLRGGKRTENVETSREEKTQAEKPEVRKNQQQLSENTRKSQLSDYAKKVELYIWNLDYSVDNKRLYKAFLPFGTIIHAKVMMEDGRSRGFGYVSYSSTAEAETAIKEMNGKMLGRRALNVSLSKAREERPPYHTRGKQMSSRPAKPLQSSQKET
ncbi:RNA-binding protein 42-like isoform X2 [Silurus meridionalis]|uniref:RNA-binding protein 42-like isoform X2 n=1 Tax=Silurus meridionalis TaxID=175797 RepID=UPI001EEADF6A|nr:RNA-binding protein 42-like isoform X2 [Silurus meridionalis]